jgi:type VI protein secretion system component Hcp
MASGELYLLLKDDVGAAIEGDVIADGFAGQIDLNNWGWNLKLLDDEDSQGKSNPSLLKFSKPVDRSSTRLMRALHDRTVLQEAQVTMAQRIALPTSSGGRGDPVVHKPLRLVFKHILVIDYALKVTSSDKAVEMSEDWTFDYRQMEVHYTGPERRGTKTFQTGKRPTPVKQEPVMHGDGAEGGDPSALTDAMGDALAALEAKVEALGKRLHSASPKPSTMKPLPIPPAKPARPGGR